MGLMNCTDCGAKHSDANGTICPNCGRKHKVGFFGLSDEEKQQEEIKDLISKEFDIENEETVNVLRHKWRDNPYALEYIDGLEELWFGDKPPLTTKGKIIVNCVFGGIYILIAYSVISFLWEYLSKIL